MSSFVPLPLGLRPLWQRSRSAPGHAKSEFASVIFQIEIKTFNTFFNRFQSLMDDCYNAYFAAREALLGRVIQSKIQLLSRNDDLISFVFSSCFFLFCFT